jgi:hypothetical protein
MTPWKWPLVVAAILFPIVAGFYVGGGGVGLGVGALTVVAIVVIAARQRPRGPIVPAPAADQRAHVLAPARIRFLDRWASDVEPAREAAQRNLVATVAALAKAGVEARARVGDEDVVQAVEDQLQTFPAGRVVLIGGGDREETDGAAAAELEARLEADFSHLVIMSDR